MMNAKDSVINGEISGRYRTQPSFQIKMELGLHHKPFLLVLGKERVLGIIFSFVKISFIC